MSALLRYYVDTTIFNLAFSLLVSAYGGFFWGIINFGTLGILVGYITFAYFKENEYYFYYNLGYTKGALIVRVWGINLVIVLGLMGVFILTLGIR